MFYTADILVYIHPVVYFVFIEWRFVVQCIGITQEIPAGAHECIHGVGFTARRFAADWASGIYELVHIFQWRFACRFEIYFLWQ